MSTPQDTLVSTITKHLDSWQLSSKIANYLHHDPSLYDVDDFIHILDDFAIAFSNSVTWSR